MEQKNEHNKYNLTIMLLLLLLSLFLLVLLACHGKQYSDFYFSFPPGSRISDGNWDYTARVVFVWSEGSMAMRSKKEVKIFIFDKNESMLLKDKYELLCGQMEAHAEWNDFSDINITLHEVGSVNQNHSRNGQFVNPRNDMLMKLKYRYDSNAESFERIKVCRFDNIESE